MDIGVLPSNISLSCPADVVRPTDPGRCGAVVSYPAPQPLDNCAGSQTACDPVPGSTFSIGTTAVNCSTIDTLGNSDSCAFQVTVQDLEAPQISCPGERGESATSPSGAIVNYPSPSASNNCPGVSVRCSQASGTTFPIGTTVVTCTATDSALNARQCSLAITVKGAGEQITDLVAKVKSFHLKSGIENSLVVKLQAALQALALGDSAAARVRLQDFINEVNAQAKKFISATQAQEMIAAADQIRAVLGCP